MFAKTLCVSASPSACIIIFAGTGPESAKEDVLACKALDVQCKQVGTQHMDGTHHYMSHQLPHQAEN